MRHSSSKTPRLELLELERYYDMDINSYLNLNEYVKKFIKNLCINSSWDAIEVEDNDKIYKKIKDFVKTGVIDKDKLITGMFLSDNGFFMMEQTRAIGTLQHYGFYMNLMNIKSNDITLKSFLLIRLGNIRKYLMIEKEQEELKEIIKNNELTNKRGRL